VQSFHATTSPDLRCTVVTTSRLETRDISVNRTETIIRRNLQSKTRPVGESRSTHYTLSLLDSSSKYHDCLRVRRCYPTNQDHGHSCRRCGVYHALTVVLIQPYKLQITSAGEYHLNYHPIIKEKCKSRPVGSPIYI
jgi:hypothetical protein